MPGTRDRNQYMYFLLFHREQLGGKCLKQLLRMAAMKKKINTALKGDCLLVVVKNSGS